MNETARKPQAPVRPSGMEIIYLYPCPGCRRQVPLVSPSEPAMAACEACGRQFPIVPVDARSTGFIKTMLANGKAGIDPDFL